MSLHHIANHLASKGRNGDETLVHMTKGEVAGLQALAKAHGTSLTKNPDTGLPEAFGLKQLLPMAVGAALTPVVGPMGAAAIVGGLQYGRTGSLTQGLMAGMGAYGGAGLAEGITAAGEQAYAGEMGANALGTTPEVFATPAGQQQALTSTIPPDYYAAGEPGTSFIDPTKAQTYSAAYSDGLTAARELPRTEIMSRGISSLGTEAGREAALTGMGGGTGAVKYGMAAAAPAMIPEQKELAPISTTNTDMGPRYAFESGYSNEIPGRTGMPSYQEISDAEAKRLYGFADGGEVQYPVGEPVMRMADGGQAAVARGVLGAGYDYSGYDAPVKQGIAEIAQQAGHDSNPNQRIADLYAQIDARRAAGTAGPERFASKFGPFSGMVEHMTGGDFVGYDASGRAVYTGGLMDPNAYKPNENGVYGPGTIQYKQQQYVQSGGQKNDLIRPLLAEGGSVSTQSFGMAAGGVASPNGGETTSQGIAGKFAAKVMSGLTNKPFYYEDGIQSGVRPTSKVPMTTFAEAPLTQAVPSNQYSGVGYGGSYTAQDASVAARGLGTGIDFSGYDTPVNQGITVIKSAANPNQNIVYMYRAIDVKKAADEARAAEEKRAAEAAAAARATDSSSYWGGAGAAQGGLMDSYAQGGISTLGGYSDGGRLLKGPGDGMSDNIPAQIGGKQPARLADGEFVVPADVVSHLGNGSTDAGAKQLYKMMDKVRSARTGRKAQGKQINPNKYVPA